MRQKPRPRERETASLFLPTPTSNPRTDENRTLSPSSAVSSHPSPFLHISSLFLFSSDERVAKRAKKEYYSTLRSHIDFFPFRSLCVYLAVLRQPVSYTRHHAVRTPLPFPDENPTESEARDAGKRPDRTPHASASNPPQFRVMTVSPS